MIYTLIAMALVFISVGLMALFVSRNVIKVPPDVVVVMTGRKRFIVDPSTGEREMVGYRVIIGGSVFRIPVIERADRLSLAEMSIDSELEGLLDTDGQSTSLSLLVNCRISSEEPALDRAIRRFLTMDLPDIEQIIKTTIESRIINLFPTVDVSNTAGWPQHAAALERAIREDLDALGIAVDNLIFRGLPSVRAVAATVNGRDAARGE